MSGSNHFVEGKVVPKWDDLVDTQDSHDRNLVFVWAFTQRGTIDINES